GRRRAGAGRDVLDRPAVERLRAAARVGELDEVVGQRGAAVAATAVDLIDDGPRRGRRRGRRQGGGAADSCQGAQRGRGYRPGDAGAELAHGLCSSGTWDLLSNDLLSTMPGYSRQPKWRADEHDTAIRDMSAEYGRYRSTATSWWLTRSSHRLSAAIL